MPGKTLDLGRSCLVAEDVGVGSAAVDQTEGDARISWVQQRALALDPEQVAPRGALDDQPLGRPGQEIGDDRVDRDAPARDRDPGLPRRHEDRTQPALSRLAVELERHGHLADRAIGADREHDLRVELEVLAGRNVQAGGRLA